MNSETDTPQELTEEKQSKAGRPTLYSEEIVSRFCELIAGSLSVRGACALCGFSEATYARWMERKPGFRKRVEKAEGESEAFLVELIRKGASKDAKHALALLERRHGGQWAKEEKHNHLHLGDASTLQRLVDDRRQRDGKVIDVAYEPVANPK